MNTVGTRVLLGRLAMIGPIAFTMAWIVAGMVQDGYSARRDYISDLAALDAQHAWIMITGFLLLGVGTAALGVGMAGAVKGRAARIGSSLVALAGVGMIVAGLARGDCRSRLDACAARIDAGDVSWHQATHELASAVVFFALVAAPLVFARAFRDDESWRDLRAYSMITGVAGMVLLVLFYAAAIGAWSWVGVVQRVFVTVLLLWVAILGARLVRLSQDRTAEPAI
jgi:hypothetical membrane protein